MFLALAFGSSEIEWCLPSTSRMCGCTLPKTFDQPITVDLDLTHTHAWGAECPDQVAEALLRGDAWNVALAAWAQHGLWRRSLWRWQDTDAVGRRTVLLAAEKSQVPSGRDFCYRSWKMGVGLEHQN